MLPLEKLVRFLKSIVVVCITYLLKCSLYRTKYPGGFKIVVLHLGRFYSQCSLSLINSGISCLNAIKAHCYSNSDKSYKICSSGIASKQNDVYLPMSSTSCFVNGCEEFMIIKGVLQEFRSIILGDYRTVTGGVYQCYRSFTLYSEVFRTIV